MLPSVPFQAQKQNVPNAVEQNSQHNQLSEELVKKYFRQIVHSSHFPCTNEFCASNPSFVLRDPNDAAALARSLALDGTASLCPDDLPEKLISRRSENEHVEYIFEEIYQHCETLSDYRDLVWLAYDTFSNVHQFNQTFNVESFLRHDDCHIHKASLKYVYKLLIQRSPSCVSFALRTATVNLLKKFKLAYESPREENIHVLAMVLFNPILSETASYSELFPLVCDIISELSLSLQDILCTHLISPYNLNGEIDPSSEEYGMVANDISNLVTVFQQFVTMCVLSRSPDMGPINRDMAVQAATKCLGMLYRLNEQGHYVHFTEFYNNAINEKLEIKEDYPNFRDKKGFSFCEYHFILNPATKAEIMRIESTFFMRSELQDAFFRALLEGVTCPYLVLEIRRDFIVRDALYQLATKSTQDFKKQLRVHFVGEEGVDEGGVQKEFFQLACRELFDRKYAMFIEYEESRLYWFDSNPLEDQSTLEEFKLIGKLFGLAIYNSVLLSVHFPLALYKKLMGQPVGLQDLTELDPTLGRGLQQLLNFKDDVESAYDRTFQVDLAAFDHHYTFDLIEGGANIKLKKENRREFVEAYVNFVLNKSVERQFNSFKEGFEAVCSDGAIKLFRSEELEQLICGCPDLDFEALESNTHYDGGWTSESQVIREFWEIVHEFTDDQKKRLLFFATGSDRVPIGGLKKLPFVIAKNGGDADRLPTSHTCFNALLLSDYTSKEHLRRCLLTAINEFCGFGLI